MSYKDWPAIVAGRLSSAGIDPLVQEAWSDQDPDWRPDGKHFRKAQSIVARKLNWPTDAVMTWEVQAYIRDRPEWVRREKARRWPLHHSEGLSNG